MAKEDAVDDVSAEELLQGAFDDGDTDEVVETEEEVSEPELSEEEVAVRAEASKMGWVDKSDYDGPPGRWVDAGEFVRRQELFDRIHAKDKHAKKLEQQLKDVAKYVKQLTESGYAEKIGQLRAQRNVAMSDGDSEQVDALNDEIVKMELAKKDVPDLDDQDDTPDEEEIRAQNEQMLGGWMKENPWFEEDADLKDYADNVAEVFSVRNPEATLEELLAHVDQKMAKRVAKWEAAQEAAVDDDDDEEEIVDEKPDKGKPMSKVAQPKRSTRSPKSKGSAKYSRADLDATQKSTLVNWILPNQIMSEEEYIKSLVASGEVAKK